MVVPPQIVLTFHKNSAAYPRYPKFVVFGYISRICNTIHKKCIYIYIYYIHYESLYNIGSVVVPQHVGDLAFRYHPCRVHYI